MQPVREHRDDLVWRTRLLVGLSLAILLVIGSTFWFVQIVQGAHYRDLAENNRLRKLPSKAPRGLIYDRDGRVLVENIPSYSLLIDRTRSLDMESSVAFAAQVLDAPPEEIRQAIAEAREAPAFEAALVADKLSLTQVARFEAKRLEHPEFEIEVRHLRLYRHGPQTSHLLGYLGEVSEEEIEASDDYYKPGDVKGKKGIEEIYDKTLRGSDGERVAVVDSRGRVLEVYSRGRSEPGQDLELSIDLELQQEAQRQLEDKVGAVVALDPRTGEVRALVSSPSYDTNLLARRVTPEQWKSIVDGENHPLQNRALQNAYSPGSVYKLMTAAAGLAEGVMTEHQRVYCGGATRIYNHPFRCWKRQGHGSVDMVDAIKGSCDIYFYNLGKDLGIERLARYSRMFGFGEKTGIDLKGEKAGLVPSPEWSLEVRKHPWYPGETISVSIGQGPILTTPIQVARATAALANGGYLVTPHLIQGDGSKPTTRMDISDDILAVSRRGAWAVVNAPGGTAGRSRIDGIEMAGKTGTVQVVAQSTWGVGDDLPWELRDHAWFSSFAPAEDPQLVVTVFVEHGGSGSGTAAPIAKAIHEKYFGIDSQRGRPGA